MPYTARRMLSKEFKSDAAVIARDHQGGLRHFAVEADNGHTEVGFSWKEACSVAANLNRIEAEDERACMMLMVTA